MRYLTTLILLFTLPGCGIVVPAIRSENKLNRLDLGMTRPEVEERIGASAVNRGAKILEDGSKLRVDEYYLYPSYTPAVNFAFGIVTLGFAWFVPIKNHSSTYWVQYVDGKLDRWGKAGDWVPTVSGALTIRNEKPQIPNDSPQQ